MLAIIIKADTTGSTHYLLSSGNFLPNRLISPSFAFFDMQLFSLVGFVDAEP